MSREIIPEDAAHGVVFKDSKYQIDETAFDDTIATVFYSGAGDAQPNTNGLFAISNADGSTFYQISNSTFDWQSLSGAGRLYINNIQASHIGTFGVAGTKTAPTFANGDILIFQAANPLTTPTVTITLSSGPTNFSFGGNAVGKWYSFSSIAVDSGFTYDSSDSYRFSKDAHPVIQIPAGSVKGGDQRWVNLDSGNLSEFEGAPQSIIIRDSTGIKEQPYDDFLPQHVNIDTLVRFPAVERQTNNVDTPAAGYFSLHSDVGGVTPVRWTAKNSRQRTLLQKYLKAAQVLQFDHATAAHIRLLHDATLSGSTFSFDAKITGTVPRGGQYLPNV